MDDAIVLEFLHKIDSHLKSIDDRIEKMAFIISATREEILQNKLEQTDRCKVMHNHIDDNVNTLDDRIVVAESKLSLLTYKNGMILSAFSVVITGIFYGVCKYCLPAILKLLHS